jgi:hypothetical protein
VVASLMQVRVTDDAGLGVDTVTATSVTVQWDDAPEDRRDGAPGSAPAG